MIDVTDVAVQRHDVTLLGPTTFQVTRGGCAAITGKNGAGKTTLLRVLAGHVKPTTGIVSIAGMAPEDRSPGYRRAVSASIGVPAYYDDLTVADHLDLINRVWREQTIDGVLEDFGVAFLARRFPRELSSGQQQLFHLALALARPAKVLILDEPEQRLDREHRLRLSEMLRRRRDSGTTIVVATHDPDLADEVATVAVRLEVPIERAG